MGVDLTEKYVKMSRELAAQGQKFNPNFLFLLYEIDNYTHLVMQGGTRSGKTYSTLQFIWKNIEESGGTEYSIVRQSSPVLKSTVMKDFKDIGSEAGLYYPSNHNLTENVYRHNSNIVDFFGVDEEEKIRGRKRHVIYMNEAPELTWDVVMQLHFRTTHKFLYDFNPSYPDSWIYDNVMSRDDCAYIITTYKDNPHNTEAQLANIEWFRINDPEQFKVYGMGLRGDLRGQIYTGWKEIPDEAFPKDADIFVLDFGYSVDPTAICRMKLEERTVIIREEIYQAELDNVDIAITLFFIGYRNDKHILVAESAEPKSISELRQGWDFKQEYIIERVAKLGYEFTSTEQIIELTKYLRDGIDVVGAIKGPDSIRNGIQRVKQYSVMVTAGSTNIWKEYRKYKWKVDSVTGKIVKTPDDKCDDHTMDAIRYGCTSHGRAF